MYFLETLNQHSECGEASMLKVTNITT